MPVRGIYRMKEKLRLLLRKPAVIALLIAELLVIGFALAAALRPAAAYTFTADQWENIAQESEIGYDEDGRIGVTEMTDGEDILQTPSMTLPKPIQVITLYNAIANDGKMISPILVRELRRDGDVVKHFKTQTLVDKVCSERTLREVRKLLESVGTEGTGAGFFRDTTLYTVAAKTGTAQYADDKIGYRDGYYIGSMVAYFPAHNPRYTVLTTIHTKRQAGKSYYGGPLSGPVVKKVVTYLYNREHDWDLSPENSGEKHYPRRIKGGDIAQIRRIADKFSPRTSFEDRKGWGTVRIDSLSNVTISTLAQDDQTMPNVVGMGLKDALFLLESRGLRVSFSGRGSVQYQSIAPGTRISRGGAVTITLK